ncbi:MAG: NUDIX domain-containing protein [Gemmatimonadaceae bacterium]
MPPAAKIPTKTQTSAGGVAYRAAGGATEVAIVLVGPRRRWQLPKGIVELGEAPEVAAMREVREEADVETEMVGPLDVVEYWYVATESGARVRFHKFVHFYLLRYARGDVRDHDREVLEARWVEIDEAREMLAFPSEQRVVERAKATLGGMGGEP